MATIVALANSKGGVGKSTLCACLAEVASRDGHRVGIADVDPQESLTEWSKRRVGAGLGDQPELLRGVETVSELVDRITVTQHWDFVFIDTPPGASTEIEAAMKAAVLTIIPVRPSSLDLVASEHAVQQARALGINYLVVVNDAVASDKLSENAMASLINWGLPIHGKAIAHRKAYITAMTTGKTGPEIKVSGGRQADAEIKELWEAVKTAMRKGDSNA